MFKCFFAYCNQPKFEVHTYNLHINFKCQIGLGWLCKFLSNNVSNEKLESYPLFKYLMLTYFLKSWDNYKRINFIPLVGINWTSPSCWRLWSRAKRVAMMLNIPCRQQNGLKKIIIMDLTKTLCLKL